MNDSFARLQRTLRAIERGERLESVDELLVRQVLKQPPPKPSGSLSFGASNNGDHGSLPADSVHGSEAYRVLVQLRKQKKGNSKSVAVAVDPVEKSVIQNEAPARTDPTLRASSPTKPRMYEKMKSDCQEQQEEDEAKARQEARIVEENRRQMRESLARSQELLVKSKREVTIARDEMDALLEASQSVLSSKFLFERNLTEFCQERSIEVIQRVLQRFKHRFYSLYYQRWAEATRQLRLVEQRRAVGTIIRVFRGHRARKLRRLLQKEAAKLRAQARQVIELRVTYRHHQALKIQRVWHRFQWKQHERSRLRRKQAAIFLQQRWRDRRLRKNALIAALTNAKAILAAIRIQKHARGLLTRRRVVRQKREAQRRELAVKILTRNTSRDALVRWKLERHGAAFIISRAMYPMILRERFRRLTKLLKRQRAGRIIASNVAYWYKTSETFRQNQRANAMEKMRVLMQQHRARLEQSAVIIQKNILRWWYSQRYRMQRTRMKKLARLKRIREKRERIAQALKAKADRPMATLVLAKASAGLVDVMKQARKKGTTPEVDLSRDAATKIQRVYLRHRHHVRFLFIQFRQQACKVEDRVRKRRAAAITIQRHIRGMLARCYVRVKRAERLLRTYIVQWRWRRATRRSQAAKQIVQWLKLKRTQRLVKLWKLEKQRQVAMAIRLQRWFRWVFFYRKRVAHLLAASRKGEEALLFAKQCLVVCTQHFTDDLILLSMQNTAFDEGIKAYVKAQDLTVGKANQKPPPQARFPIMPLVFLVVCGFKNLTTYTSEDLKDLLSAKMERSKMVALFRAANKQIPSGGLSPQRKQKQLETFSMTDVDLVMAKAAGASKRALTFSEFVEAIRSLADMRLTTVSLWWSKYDGTEARVLVLLWHFLFPISDVKTLATELSAYASRVIDAHARVIQRVFLRKRDRAKGLLLKLQVVQQREIEYRKAAIIKVQASVRRLLARKIHRTKIQETYEKFIDPDWGLPYWMNPKTGFSTWNKPWVLGDVDVKSETVPFPSADKILSVPCQGKSDCKTCSDWYCYPCDEFFCDACEPIFHKQKDGDPSHEMERLRKCGLCKFQIASRKCTSCADSIASTTKKKAWDKTKNSDPSTAEPLEQDILYCDVCFAFVHRRGALQMHKSVALVELCDDCLDDDKLLDAEKAPLVAKPYARAVQWSCTADKKRVCTSCASLLHPVEACGELTRIQLTTIQMKERAELLARLKEERERSDTELIKQRELQVKRERASKKIQAFWRNSAPLIRARRVTRDLRAKKDALWRQRQQDRAVEKTLQYQLKNAFGMASPLPSDTIAQRKLREMNAFQRRQMGIRARAFGLLLPEYMQLGVPLPGIARVTTGTKFMECSEDLRGWILNRQTIRLKKLPSKEERERVRRIRSRRHAPSLEDRVWLHDLEMWMRDPTDTTLVDVDAKQRITEHNVPLATAFMVDPKAKPSIEEPMTEEFAMFLVEFSMDPTRVVWISHSFAERFAVWSKQKLLEYKEKRRLPGVKSDGEDIKANVVNVAQEEIAPAPPDVDSVNAEEGAVNSGEYGIETAEHAWGSYGEYDYTNYYSENPWAGSSYSSSVVGSPYGYDAYNYNYAAPATDNTEYENNAAPYETTTQSATTYDYASSLVSSSNYFYSDDGNAAAWEAYYQAHPEMAASYDYSSQAYDPNASAMAEYSQYPYQEAGGQDVTDYGQSFTQTNTNTSPSSVVYPWEEVFDPTTQQSYYYNHETQQTSWGYPYYASS